jgi:hypothetical protein
VKADKKPLNSPSSFVSEKLNQLKNKFRSSLQRLTSVICPIRVVDNVGL